MTAKGELYVEVFDGKDIVIEGAHPSKKTYEDSFLGATAIDTTGSGANWKPVTLSRAPKNDHITLITFDEDKAGDKEKGASIGKPIPAGVKYKKSLVGQNSVAYAGLTGAGKNIGVDAKKSKGTLAISIAEDKKKEDEKDKDKDKAKSVGSSGHGSKGEKGEKDDKKAGSSSSKGKSGDSSDSDKVSIEYLQQLARYQVAQAQKKVDDAKAEQLAAQQLLDRLVRLQPKRAPADQRTEASSRLADDRAYSPRARYDDRRRFDDFTDDDFPPLTRRYGPPPPHFDPYDRPGFIDARPLRPVGYGFAPAPPIITSAPIIGAPPPFSAPRYY
jgi:hypothetical protein